MALPPTLCCRQKGRSRPNHSQSGSPATSAQRSFSTWLDPKHRLAIHPVSGLAEIDREICHSLTSFARPW
jgi:hypothetical protein